MIGGFSDYVITGRDKPLSFHWKTLDDRWIDSLGLPPARSDKERRARAAILTEVVIVGHGEPDRWISYSRRKEFYANQERYQGTAYKYSTVTSTVDLLDRHGLVEHDKKSSGNHQKTLIDLLTP